MVKQTENIKLNLFDYDNDSVKDFAKGLAGIEESNMQKIDRAVSDKVKVNGDAVQSVDFIGDDGIEKIIVTQENGIEEYHLPSKTNHIKTPTGIDYESRYTKLLKTMSKEFSSDGSDIVVDDGINNQKVTGLKMEGNTIKNLLRLESKDDLVLNPNVYTKFLNDGYIRIEGGNNGGTAIRIKKESLNVEPNKTYTFFFFTRNITIEASQLGGIRTNNNPDSYFNEYYTAGIKQEGINKIKFTSKSDFSDVTNAFSVTVRDEIKTGAIEFKIVVLEGDWMDKDSPMCEPIPYGLHSTKVTIANNENQYSFYNPIIEGKTYLMKTPKGTQNWIIDDISEERDFDKYDYKLESPNGLNSVYGYKDIVNLQTREITTNTISIKLDEIIDNNFMTVNGNTKENTSVFGIVTDIPIDKSVFSVGKNYIRCNALDTTGYTSIIVTSTTECCATVYSGNKLAILMRVDKDKSLGTKDGFKNYYRGRGIEFIVVNDIPVTRSLTAEEYEMYYKKVELSTLNKVSNIVDKFEIVGNNAKITKNLIVGNFFDVYRLKSVGEKTVLIEFSYGAVDYSASGKIICNKLKTVPYISSVAPEEESIGYAGYVGHIAIDKSKLKNTQAQTVVDYLFQNDYQIMIPSKETNKEITISKELMTQIIPTHEINKFSFGDEVKPSKATVNIPVDKISYLEKEIKELSSTLSSVSNLSVLDNYVTEEYNKEICNICEIQNEESVQELNLRGGE